MKRMVRVNELLRREISTIFEHDIAPDISGIVTVTDVDTSPDLRQAVVHLSVYGNDVDPLHVIQLVLRRRAQIQQAVAARVRIKYTPVLRFKLDDQHERADRIYQILDQLEPDEPSTQ